MSNSRPEDAPTDSSAAPLNDPAAPGADTNPRVEDFLDRVYARLVRWVPYERRQEFRKEMRSHLLSMIEAEREKGVPVGEATERAVRRFGRPRRLAREFLKAGNYMKGSLEEAFTFATAGFGLSLLLLFALFVFSQVVEDPMSLLEQYRLDLPLVYLIYVVNPFLVGLFVGERAQWKAFPGLLLSGAFLASVTLAVGLIGEQSQPGQMGRALLPLEGVWVLIGLVGAALANVLRLTVGRYQVRINRRRPA
jgi:hypothetical protein